MEFNRKKESNFHRFNQLHKNDKLVQANTSSLCELEIYFYWSFDLALTLVFIPRLYLL